jgi:type II secretory pathway pseudopilin PulG
MNRPNFECGLDLKGDTESIASTSPGEAGFTLSEVVIVLYVIVMLVTIALYNYRDGIEEARLARCMSELRGIQTAIYVDSDNGRRFMSPASFWSSHFHGQKPGPYHYLLDGDPNSGHGNDLDGVDEENPGASDPDKKDIKFVVMCSHDHKWLGKYVYVTDEEPPRIVGGETGEEDPGYARFLKWEYHSPGTGSG